MNKGSTRAKHVDFIIIDFLCVLSSMWLAYVIWIPQSEKVRFYNNYLALSVVMLLTYFFIVFFLPIHSGILRRGFKKELEKILVMNLGILGVMLSYLFIVKITYIYSRMVFGLFFIFDVILMSIMHAIWKKMLIKRYTAYANQSKVMVVTYRKFLEETCAEEGIYHEDEKEKMLEKNDYNYNIKKSINTEYKFDNNKSKTKLDLNIELNDIDKKYNFIPLSNEKNRISEVTKTPESKKEREKLDFIKSNKNNFIHKKKKNLSFNRKENKNIFRLNKINNINEYRNKSNNKLFQIKCKNDLINNMDDIALLTERNNSNKKSRFKMIFEKKLFRNKDLYMNNNIFYYNKNLTCRGDKNLYDKHDNTKYQKTKNYFTRKDFYF